MIQPSKVKKNVKVIIKKKNNPKNQNFIKKGSTEMGESIGSKKVGGFSDYFSIYRDPNKKEFMDSYNGFGGQENENDFESLGFKTIHFEDNDGLNGFSAFLTRDDVWGNDKKGDDWVEEQKKRKKNQYVFQPGQIHEIAPENREDDQIVYIEPSHVDQTLQKLKRQGKQFYDDEFPPNDESLSGPYGRLSDWEPVKWKKLSACYENPQIFVDKASPRDIKQGFLGDCYFLAGLAALAQRPDRIFNLFLTTQRNQVNYYSLKMLYRGKWRTIHLDQYVPTVYDQIAFSKSDKQQLWVILLEKAWAKMYGCYKQIQAGFAEEPLHDLTGAPIKYLFLQKDDPEQNWKTLIKASKLQYGMVASSNPGSDTDKSASGIVQGHAYTFLNATEINTQDGKEKIVQLRNPWGSGQFKGKWSDFDEDWKKISKKQKKRINYDQDRDDGIFFMRYSDFMTEFRSMTIAQINDNASYVYESCVDEDCEGVYFTVNIAKPGKYSFQIDKTPDRAYFGEKLQNFRYPRSEIKVGKIDEGQYTKRFQGLISERRTLYQAHELTPGKYVVWARIKYDPYYEKDFDVTLAVYSEYVCEIKLSTQEQAAKFTGDASVNWGQHKSKELKHSAHLGKSMKRKGGMNFNQKNAQNIMRTEGSKKTNFDSKTDIKEKSNQNSKVSLFSSKNKLATNTKSLKERIPEKGKRIRTIEYSTTTVTTTKQKKSGQTIIKSQIIQKKKQTLATHDAGKKMRENEKKTQIVRNQYMGELLKQSQNFYEKTQTANEAPNGEIMKKIRTKEGKIETLEEDDDGDDDTNLISSIRLEEESQSDMKELNEEEMNEEEKKEKLKDLQEKIWTNKNKRHVNLENSENLEEVIE